MTLNYFDHNATTRVDDEVLDAMLPYFQQEFGNASSRHAYGTAARQAVDRARKQVAAAVGVQPVQVIFTSGGSEANNLFVRGAADSLKAGHIAISAIEHPCVLKPAQALAQRTAERWMVRHLPVNQAGQVDIAAARDAMAAQKPALVSVMLANNETGVIQDVAAVADLARAHGAYIHTDAVQGWVRFRSILRRSMSMP